MSKTRVYSTAGALLSLGAPLGLVLVRALSDSEFTLRWIRGELLLNLSIYGYVTASTLIAFASFGAVLGGQADALERQSRVDHLTGLLNRRALEERMDEEFARAVRHGLPLSFLLLDVDNLKRINDSLGHGRGDEALRRTAGVIVAATRVDDLSARWGGDEFAILAPRTDAAEALILAERIRQRAASDASGGLTLSIGVASVLGVRGPAGAADPARSLFLRADSALYEAKAAGRNRVVMNGGR